MSIQANCPACGGPCTFKISTSLVAVCPYCRSVVARGDRRTGGRGTLSTRYQNAGNRLGR